MKSVKLMSMCSALWCALHASGVGAAPVTAVVGGPEIALTTQPIAGTPNYSFDYLKLDSGVVDQYLSSGGPRPAGDTVFSYGTGNTSAMKFAKFAEVSFVASAGSQVRLEQGNISGRTLPAGIGTVGADFISPLTNATFDDDSGQLLALSTNSTFNWTAPAGTGSNLQAGGSISFSNLSIDFQTRTVSATVAGQSNNGAALVPQTLTLFTFADQHGIDGLPREALRSELASRFPLTRALAGSGWEVADDVAPSLAEPSFGMIGWGGVSGLTLTQAGQTAVTQALGLPSGSTSSALLNQAANDFGGIEFGLGLRMAQSYDWTLPVPPFTVARLHGYSTPAVNAIPEPGTWALMGLGLLILPLATRRKARQTH